MLSASFENYLREKFDLNSLSKIMAQNFLDSMKKYMIHARYEETINGMNRRNEETVKNHLENLSHLLSVLGFSSEEMVVLINNNSSLIHDTQLYLKILFLGFLEPYDLDGKIRKGLLISKNNDLRCSLELMWARYQLMIIVEYPSISWSNVLHDSEREFAQKFVKGKYKKPYQLYNEITDLTSKKLMELYPINPEILNGGDFLKTFSVNERIVALYENKTYQHSV